MSGFEIRVAYAAFYLRRFSFLFTILTLIGMFNNALIADATSQILSENDPLVTCFAVSMIVYVIAKIVVGVYSNVLPRRERGLYRLMP